MTYSNSIAVNRRPHVRRNQNSVAYTAAAKSLGPVSNSIILLALLCLIGLLYLTQVTKTNSYWYTINSLQEQQSVLRDQKTDLEISAARWQSLDRVSNSSVAKTMVPATPIGTLQ